MRERETADWERLFNEANPGFRVIRIKRPSATKLGIIETEWMGTEDINDVHQISGFRRLTSSSILVLVEVNYSMLEISFPSSPHIRWHEVVQHDQ